MKTRKFIDRATAFVKAGDGGDGCASFRREKYVPKGGPDGGDGGHGGNVVFKADTDTDSLISVYFAPHIKAGRGAHGKGKRLRGKNGDTVVTLVPPGTEIWDQESGELLADLTNDGQELLVARGGQGGLGNCHWVTPTHQAPREFTRGEEGEERTLRLELKISADIGLVGFPNAGKSSLLAAVSHAHPKIASYAFTTLNPIIGTMIFEDYSRVRVADIPGLIEGAHKGVGLGHDFLRHIERARFLLLVIDMAGTDGREPHDDYAKLLDELKAHDPELIERPMLVVANKMDEEIAAEHLAEFTRETGVEPIQVSAVLEQGLDTLQKEILRMVRQSRSE